MKLLLPICSRSLSALVRRWAGMPTLGVRGGAAEAQRGRAPRDQYVRGTARGQRQEAAALGGGMSTASAPRPGSRERDVHERDCHHHPSPQRLRALERANEIRLARAELKRRIAYGEVSAAEVILYPPLEAKVGPSGIC